MQEPKKSNTNHLIRRFLTEWLFVLFMLTTAFYVFNGTKIAALTNNYVYDRLLTQHLREADPQIVIIGIDDSSLQELGHWPWSRQTHTTFLKELYKYEPKAVLFDILTIEPSKNPNDDTQLGNAMGLFERLAAPILLSSYAGELPEVTLPIPPVANNAHLGQILVTADDDGVVRQTFLSIKDKNGKPWSILPRLLLDKASQKELSDDEIFKIPFNVPKAGYVTLPYWSILNHQVPSELLKGKYILVGATATGLGDQQITPISGAQGAIAGIEIHANVLDTLINHLQINEPRSTWVHVLNIATPILILMLAFLWVGERFYLSAFILVFGVYSALVLYLLWAMRFWLPPVATLLGLLLTYVVWGWRRSTVLLAYVYSSLKNAQDNLGDLTLLFEEKASSHFLPQTIEQNMSQISQLYQLIGDSLAHLPTALVVINHRGEILMRNQLANQIFSPFAQAAPYLTELLQQIDSSIFLKNFKENWGQLHGIELKSKNNQYFQLHLTNILLSDNAQKHTLYASESGSVWLVNFINLSAERSAEKQRAELVTFLSHDLRTPQVSILSLLELQQHENTRTTETLLFEKIADKVYRTLGWANDLVGLSQAQNNAYTLIEANFANIIDDIFEQIWPQAQAKNIDLIINDNDRTKAEDIWLKVDGKLLTRALINLLSNAVRYSNDNSQVRLTVDINTREMFRSVAPGTDSDNNSHILAEHWLSCCIINQGHGMTESQVSQLNSGEAQHKRTISQSSLPPDAAQSLGIGFIMTKTVIKRHGGILLVESEAGKGTRITVWLPIINDDFE